MKYKLISIALILFLLIGSIWANNYYNLNIPTVYHQHLEDSSDESACLNTLNCSHLPIVNLRVNNLEIPQKNTDINSDEKDYIIGDVEIYDNGDNVNSLADEHITITSRIRYRGRSSLAFDKKSYLLKFVDNSNKKIEQQFLGMPSANEWILYGPFIDKTLIRNYMWYNISQEIMGLAPKTRFLELYLNDTYQGVYLAVEAVTQSEESRVKIEAINKNSFATSYLIQLDDNYSSLTNIDSLSKYTYKVFSPINLTIKYPIEDSLTDEVRKYIYDDFMEFEKMLYSYDYKEYKQYIDVDSFVDYFIINEFTQNYDAGTLSTYIYKNVDGKYKMYVWDFNSANNNYEEDLLAPFTQCFEFDQTIWFEMLLRDPEFVDAIIKRYEELRKTYLSDAYLNNYIDDTVAYLGEAIDRNFAKWGYTLEPGYDQFHTNFMPTSYEEAVDALKEAIRKRAEWMDLNIYTLKQYAHPSKNKNFNK